MRRTFAVVIFAIMLLGFTRADATTSPPSGTLDLTCTRLVATATNTTLQVHVTNGYATSSLVGLEVHGTAKLVFAPHATGTITATISTPPASRTVVC